MVKEGNKKGGANGKLRRRYPNTKLGKYGVVYVKPNIGTGGHGVMRVKRVKAENGYRYGYHLENQRPTFPTYEALFQSMSRKMGRRTHLVQKGIDVLKARGRPLPVNTRPDPFIFRKLRNKSVFQRVFRLTRLHSGFRGNRH